MFSDARRTRSILQRAVTIPEYCSLSIPRRTWSTFAFPIAGKSMGAREVVVEGMAGLICSLLLREKPHMTQLVRLETEITESERDEEQTSL